MNIPTNLHWVWLGTSEPDELLYECQQSVIDLHPRWQVWVHRNKDAEALLADPIWDQLQIDVRGFWSKIDQYKGRHDPNAIRADLWRLMILYLYGGFTLDWDLWGVRPLERHRQEELVYAMVSWNAAGEGLLGAPKGSQHVLNILRDYVKQDPSQGDVSSGIDSYGMRHALYGVDSECFWPHGRDEAHRKYDTRACTSTIHLWRQLRPYDMECLRAITRKASEDDNDADDIDEIREAWLRAVQPV